MKGRPFGNYTGWKRIDTLGNGKEERYFAAGPDDQTDLYQHWEPGKYDAYCSCCFLNIPHTVARHKKGIA